MYLIVDGEHSLISYGLIVGIKSELNVVYSKFLNSLKHLGVGIRGLEGELGLADFGNYGVDELNNLLVLSVTGHNGVEHNVIGNLVSACLNHSNEVRGRGYGKLKVVLCLLLCGGVKNNLTINKTYRNTRNGAFPRNVGNRKCDRSTNHSGDFR